MISHSDPILLMNRKYSIRQPHSTQELKKNQDILVARPSFMMMMVMMID